MSPRLSRLPGAAPPRQSRVWPTARQELLLRAALEAPEPAVGAWRQWRACTDLVEDPLDEGSLRLLPLVYRNLARHGFDDPMMPRLKGVYRYWWLRNQSTFGRAADVVTTLSRRGIDTMVLKGAALSALYYQDSGARPMSDLDLLVPPGAAAQALASLKQSGWTACGSDHPDVLRFRHALGLVDEIGAGLDLHWRVLSESVCGHGETGFWKRSVPCEVSGVPTRALDPTDTLFQVVVHGQRWNPVPPLRWIADAMTVLALAGDELDWDRLLEAARERRVVLRLRQGLAYLNRQHHARIPEAAMATLGAARVSMLERLEARYLMMDDRQTQRLLVPGAPHLLIAYLRAASGLGPTRGLAVLPDFLVYRFNLRRRRDLPARLLRLTAREAYRLTVRGLTHLRSGPSPAEP